MSRLAVWFLLLVGIVLLLVVAVLAAAVGELVMDAIRQVFERLL